MDLKYLIDIIQSQQGPKIETENIIHDIRLENDLHIWILLTSFNFITLQFFLMHPSIFSVFGHAQVKQKKKRLPQMKQQQGVSHQP